MKDKQITFNTVTVNQNVIIETGEVLPPMYGWNQNTPKPVPDGRYNLTAVDNADEGESAIALESLDNLDEDEWPDSYWSNPYDLLAV